MDMQLVAAGGHRLWQRTCHQGSAVVCVSCVVLVLLSATAAGVSPWRWQDWAPYLEPLCQQTGGGLEPRQKQQDLNTAPSSSPRSVQWRWAVLGLRF